MNYNIVVDIAGTPHCVDGNKSFPIADEDIVLAAVTKNGLHYVLAHRSGNLFDPSELFSNPDHKGHKIKHNKCKLVKCNQRCYDFFVTYLRSRNRTHFTLARREFQNG